MQRHQESKTHLVLFAASLIFGGMALLVLFQYHELSSLRSRFDSIVQAESSQRPSLLLNNNDIALCAVDGNGQGRNTPLEDISRSVCLIQGEYIFVDRTGELVSWKELNGVIAAANIMQGQTDDDRHVDIQYTGSGFMLDSRGYIVTNKHVALPWSETYRDRQIIDAGYKPKLVMFRAFFPGFTEPFELEYVNSSHEDDLAVLKIKNYKGNIPVLDCDYDSAITVGMPLTVLGYPTGFDLLTARIGAGGAVFNYSCFDELGTELAKNSLIKPMATSGICGQVNSEKIAYDAATAIGASGAPVLNEQGRVIAINTALLKGFSGTNFGVPISKIKLLFIPDLE